MKNMFKLIALTLAVSLGAGSLNAAATALGATTAATRAPLTPEEQRFADNTLLDAARRGDLAAVEAALNAGADVNAAGQADLTALYWAAFYGRLDVAKRLLDAGAKVNAQCKALHWAAFYGHLDVAKLLLDAGADVNAADNDGNTALHLATYRKNNAPVTTLLLDQPKIKVNAADKSGWTALHSAVVSRNPDVVKLLLFARPKIDVNVPDKRGRTAVELARNYGYPEIIALIRDYLAAKKARWSTLRGEWVGLLVAQQALDAE